MDLYSGLPYWIAKNPLYEYYNPLEKDHSTDVLIIGTGITGALVAHELCSAGIKCTMIDKRGVSEGSSTSSTALLQYEIDTPLSELTGLHSEELAVKAYKASLKAVSDIRNVFSSLDMDVSYERVPSVFYASNNKGLEMIKREYLIRKKHGIPVNYLDEKELFSKYGFKATGALSNEVSAQMDPYEGATKLINYHLRKSELNVFTNTEVTGYSEKKGHCTVKTASGHKIKCLHVVIAAGFEAGKLMKEKVMKLTSTYAIISEPVKEEYIWPGRALIWETKEPYLYIRTTNTNRVIVGGEDEDFKNPDLRDALLKKKTAILEKKIKKLFPRLPFNTDMSWCGTFSSTKDGLPFIGSVPDKERTFYALGYGGNGITFSMIAAQVIKNKLTGTDDQRERIFGFERLEKSCM